MTDHSKIHYILARDDSDERRAYEEGHRQAQGLANGVMIGLGIWGFLLLVLWAVTAEAATAFLTREFVRNEVKTCVYSYMGSEYYRSINAMEFCPPSIQV